MIESRAAHRYAQAIHNAREQGKISNSVEDFRTLSYCMTTFASYSSFSNGLPFRR